MRGKDKARSCGGLWIGPKNTFVPKGRKEERERERKPSSRLYKEIMKQTKWSAFSSLLGLSFLRLFVLLLQQLSGATLLDNDPFLIGIDFAILRLSQNIPASFNPYYLGWDASPVISGSTIGIHHPGYYIATVVPLTLNFQSSFRTVLLECA